jgi:Inner membrane component of T3SS, cytoplasmic domain
VPVLLEILTGPDQGKTFPLESELLHIGRGSDNGIILTDPQIGDFHASVSQQQGRLSLYANEANQIQVAGTLVPGQQWIPVPTDAKIHLGGQTEVRVVDSTKATVPATEASPPTERRRTPPKKESKRQVARPITSRGGEAAVQMGADGKFPELALTAGTELKKTVAKPKESNPALLFTILAASCLSSAGLLLVDFETTTVSSSEDLAFTRSQLAAYYGTDSAQLEPYQKLLRRASVEYSQGNRAAERQLLKQVLALLHSVDASAPENLNGLTGRQFGQGKASDQKLEKLLQEILN